MVNVEVFVAAFSALAVIFAGAFYWILSEFRTVKQDIQTLRNQNLEDNSKFRDEFTKEIRALREEFREENRALREEFKEENRALREEFKEENRVLREELRQEIRDNAQRILDAIFFHRHDPDGTVALRPPNQQAAD